MNPSSWLSITGRQRQAGRLALAAGLAILLAGAADDLSFESPEGSFPDHGSCSYLGRQDGKSPVATLADDLEAMRMRTSQTQHALASMPFTRAVARPSPSVPGIKARAANPASCAGIDDCIQRKAHIAGVPLTFPTTDAEFLRRVRLDLTGRIPTREEVVEFLGDTSADKRARLVDRLLETPEWADRWAMFFGDLFRNTEKTAQVNRYADGRDSLHLYLLESLRRNKPYDQMAREMVAAEGYSDGRIYPDSYTSLEHFRSVYDDYETNPVQASPVGYVVGGRTTGGPIQDTYDTLAFVTARDFLGIALMDCVLCHDGAGHLDALSVWGAGARRLEGWQMAAFFSDIPRYQSWRAPARSLPTDPATGRRVKANYHRIRDLAPGRQQVSGAGDTAGDYLAQTAGGNRPDRLHDERYVAPAYPFGGNAVVPADFRLREQLGVHLTADPQFARAAVNYIWRHFFSRGIVEPPDQFDLARLDPAESAPDGWEAQPSHPELLEWLARGFRNSGFDLKWLMREIAGSRTYQLSSRYEGVFNPLDEKYFARHQVKRLTAEEMHDAIVQASGEPTSYSVSRTMHGLQRAMQFPDVVELPRGYKNGNGHARQLLQAFTPGDREETPRSGDGSPLQALNLMNNPFVLDRTPANGRAGTLAEALQMADDALVVRLYLTVLSRLPTAEELAFAVDYLQDGNRSVRASNLLWVMFNKTDFYFNY